jgi:prenylcysteine oxidase / farnesylcysteine lyase
MKSLAVIGGGIGGCAAAYFASKHFPTIKVTIYEAQERLGGRILTRNVSGLNLEVGAAFFNDTNKTIVDLVKSEQLKVNRLKERKNFAVWNGTEFLFRSSNQSTVTYAKLLFRYKLSLLRIFLKIEEAKKQFAKLYQEEQKTPSEIGKLLESAGLDMWYKKSFDEILFEAGVSHDFVDEIAAPITRTIYCQDANIGGLAGISSMIGVYSDKIYGLADGNSALPTSLAEASNSIVKLGQKVSGIEKTSEGTYRIFAGEDSALFDAAIIAAPIECAEIKFEGLDSPNIEPQSYRTIYRRAARGVFNPRYFGLENSSNLPGIVLTTKDVDSITQYSIQKVGSDESLVTVSSVEPLNDEVFGGFFKNEGITVFDHCWKAAYPKFKPIAELPSTKLDEHLYYLDSIEASVSSMETSAFSALNVVRMLIGDFR